MSTTALLLMLLFNAAVCLCLPRVLTLLWSNLIRPSLDVTSERRDNFSLGDRTAPSRPEFSQSEVSPELTSFTY